MVLDKRAEKLADIAINHSLEIISKDNLLIRTEPAFMDFAEYKKGKIVKFSAEKNHKFLESMLNLKGAKRIGELGIGCNYGVKKYINNLLFDEKIGGTIHLALGDSYKRDLMDGGGKNYGEIHWDLVCDLRKINGLPGGEIYVDGKLVQRHGKWIF